MNRKNKKAQKGVKMKIITNIQAYKASNDFNEFISLLDNYYEIVCFIKIDKSQDKMKHFAVAYKTKDKRYILYSIELLLKVYIYEDKNKFNEAFNKLGIEFILPNIKM